MIFCQISLLWKRLATRFSVGEVAVVAFLLFAAGFETTTNLIGNGMVALLQNPGADASTMGRPVVGGYRSGGDVALGILRYKSMCEPFWNLRRSRA